jgi:hypothetical protein
VEARFSAPVLIGPGAHPASCTMGTGSFPGGKEQPGRDADPSPASSAVGHERVELYLYSPYGPYGLYRASVPVQGCTLPLPLPIFVLFLNTLYGKTKDTQMLYSQQHIEDLSFIAVPSTATLLHRKPASAGPSHGSCVAQGNHERNAQYNSHCTINN